MLPSHHGLSQNSISRYSHVQCHHKGTLFTFLLCLVVQPVLDACRMVPWIRPDNKDVHTGRFLLVRSVTSNCSLDGYSAATHKIVIWLGRREQKQRWEETGSSITILDTWSSTFLEHHLWWGGMAGWRSVSRSLEM